MLRTFIQEELLSYLGWNTSKLEWEFYGFSHFLQPNARMVS
jgi:hypothetical protein